MNSARRACNGSSSSPWEFLRRLKMTTAIAPTNTIAPNTINPISHLDVCDLHHDEITCGDHANNDTDRYPSAQWSASEETANIFGAYKPQGQSEEHWDQRQHCPRCSNVCRHNTDFAFD